MRARARYSDFMPETAPFLCARGAFTGNEEPSLDEILAEPIVRLVMARDRVSEAEVRRIAAEARARRQDHRMDDPKQGQPEPLSSQTKLLLLPMGSPDEADEHHPR
jgi:hypothetical protein